MKRGLIGYVRWREDEEDNRLSSAPNPDRVVKITPLPCLRCGLPICRADRADGTHYYDALGVVSSPDGVRHHVCPEAQ